MMLTYQNLEIEIFLEGIICIDSVYIVQKLNEHGKAGLKALIEDEKALEMVEQADCALSVKIYQRDPSRKTIFCGRTSQIRIENEEGLFYLYLDFCGYTGEWDLTEKCQSFLRGKDTYEQVIHKVLSEYNQFQIRDEITNGKKIPGILMQYEETDWEFLKRLASHFSTALVVDSTQSFGKVYFGIPSMDHGTVLEEKEYILFKEKYGKFSAQEEIMPQEMMNWHIRSSKYMQIGEQVMLGHIEVVVTEVDIHTKQGELVYEYRLSRRKGILVERKKNPKIYGMSIPATVKERKGNQVRVQMDIDPVYEAAGDLKYFTYAIETSNFYCMPEEGSRVHIYFPEHEEQSAMAVHALRVENNSCNAGGGPAAIESHVSENYSSGAYSSGSNNSSGGGIQTTTIVVQGGNTEKGFGNTLPNTGTGTENPQEKTREQQEEKDPSHKVFSDTSGSFMELAPEGITFVPGGGKAALTLESTGVLSIAGLLLSFKSESNIMAGIGKEKPVSYIGVKAANTFKVAMTRKTGKIVINEETRIVAEFIKEEAEIKCMAMPPASAVKAELTAGDAEMRAGYNEKVRDGLTKVIKDKLLEEKEKAAKQEIFNGVLVGLTTIGGAAAIVLSGGTLTPAVAGLLSFLAANQLTSATSDVIEGISDLNKVEAGDISRSTNMMRDSFFGGNEANYRGFMLVNQLTFSVVSGMALTQSLNTASSANSMANSLKSYQAWCNNYPVASVAVNVTGDIAIGVVSDYIDDGKIDPGTIISNALSGAAKGIIMGSAHISPGNKYITTPAGRMAANWVLGTAAGTGYDYVESEYLIPEKEFSLTQSLFYNAIISSAAIVAADPNRLVF